MAPLKETHTLRDCLYWNLFGLIPLSLAVSAIAQDTLAWVAVYIIVFIGHFIVLEYRFFCTHCPHYCNQAATTRCMFLWAVPKFFKKNPGPLTKTDLAMMAAGFAVTIFFPTYWLVQSPSLAIPYFLSWLVLMMTVRRYECCRCIYFNCPSNTVPESGKNRSPDKAS